MFGVTSVFGLRTYLIFWPKTELFFSYFFSYFKYTCLILLSYAAKSVTHHSRNV